MCTSFRSQQPTHPDQLAHPGPQRQLHHPLPRPRCQCALKTFKITGACRVRACAASSSTSPTTRTSDTPPSAGSNKRECDRLEWNQLPELRHPERRHPRTAASGTAQKPLGAGRREDQVLRGSLQLLLRDGRLRAACFTIVAILRGCRHQPGNHPPCPKSRNLPASIPPPNPSSALSPGAQERLLSPLVGSPPWVSSARSPSASSRS